MMNFTDLFFFLFFLLLFKINYLKLRKRIDHCYVSNVSFIVIFQ